MAKSIRSKWKRKCRAVKRVRYGNKELERLKKTLGIDNANKTELETAMKTISEIADVKESTTTNTEQVEVDDAENEEENQEENDIEMEVDGKKRIFNSKTYKDQNGSYPVWLHPRKMKKSNKKNKATKRLKNKASKKTR